MSCRADLLATNSLSFCFYGNAVISLLKHNFARPEFWVDSFFFADFKHVIPLPSGPHGF